MEYELIIKHLGNHLGPSGAGKTSILNLLAGRLQSQKGKGATMMEGHTYKKRDLKRLTGYVMQDDIFFPYLTVRETMIYAAYLRLSSAITLKEKRQRVDDLIFKLGLERCKNTLVGDSLKKGISGGERKRLAIGVELLTNPKILFLDEPTSGLDSVTSLTIVRILKELARSERTTIVCTIHQPSTKLFNEFDDLMVLKSGRIVYHGAVSKVLDYYSNAGFPCPKQANPGDHVLDIITPSSYDAEGLREADQNAETLMSFYKPVEDLPEPKKGKVPVKTPKRAPWWIQFVFLTQRALRSNLRAYLILAAQFLQNIILAFLVGGVFYQIGDDQGSIPKRNSVLFFIIVNQGVFASMILINSFPSERIVVLRERAGGMYCVSAYYLSKIIADSLIQFIFPILFGTIVYFMVGLQNDAGKFFIFLCFVELCSFAATSLALAISAISRTVTLAVTLLPFAFEVCRLFGAFYLPPSQSKKYYSWVEVWSFCKYSYLGLAQNEWRGLTLTCTAAQANSTVTGNCPIQNGEQQIDLLDLDEIPLWACAVILIAYIILFRIIAYFAVRYDLLWSKVSWANIKTCCGLIPWGRNKMRRDKRTNDASEL
eukprot:TRINITY_DN1528_c0_g2_i3.p1 TRINITY_DN1528_c0_g2~~TRINITY_DN1528_c0_g2_i3.p1  ORF type:complete len:598 (-),score=116.75 TRINITY_DN1528_c0_g2_i3:57-1850(-)